MIMLKNNIESKDSKFTYYCIVDPNTNQVIGRVDKQSYDYHQRKKNEDIQPNLHFDNESSPV